MGIKIVVVFGLFFISYYSHVTARRWCVDTQLAGWNFDSMWGWQQEGISSSLGIKSHINSCWMTVRLFGTFYH